MKQSIAKDYRDTINRIIRFPLSMVPEGEDFNTYLYQYLNQMWKQNLLKYHIHCLKEKLTPIIHADDFRVILFTSAIGLLTYGRKDVIPFIIQDVSSIGHINRLSIIIFKLLPLPENLKDINKKSEILDWLENHYEQLTWDEAQEVFYLKEVE